MKLIPLTQGQFAKVDDDDFERFGHLKWYAQWNKSTKSFYAVRSCLDKNLAITRAVAGRRPQIKESLHREILRLSDPKIKGDHKNHDTLDCRKMNLRVVTNSQNAMNKNRARADSISGIRGVEFRWNRWIAKIQIDGRRVHLGCFLNKQDAISAYRKANAKHFGEFGGHIPNETTPDQIRNARKRNPVL